MKKILLLLFVCTILFKNADVTFIPVQSLFFVIALKKYGIFTPDKIHKYNNVKPVLFILCGLCLSILFLLYSGTDILKANILYSIDTFSLYLLFYSVIIFMFLSGKQQRFLRLIFVIFTLFPCFSILSPEKSSLIFTVVMLVFSTASLFLSVLYAKRKGAS